MKKKNEKVLVPQCLSILVPSKRAFTLAEVLITLGIIGVVAAMTIPTLVANYQEKSWNTSASVFERKLEEALKTMNTQSSLAGHSSTKSFVEELSNHFKINKICDNNKLSDCIENNITWEIINISNDTESEELELAKLKTASDIGQSDWESETIGIQFANGVTAIVAYNDYDCRQDPYSNQISGTNCLAMIYDTSGFKSPNTTKKDIRGINSLLNKCSFRSDSVCFGMPFKPEPYIWNACDTSGNTTDADDLAFMSKYGISKCMSSDYGTNDNWAGAVKACGGVDKMPTQAQLAELANYVYNTTGLTTSYTDGLTLDTAKALSLNFTLNSSNAFYVWSGEEHSAYDAYYSYFVHTYSGCGNNARRNSAPQAVCLSD